MFFTAIDIEKSSKIEIFILLLNNIVLFAKLLVRGSQIYRKCLLIEKAFREKRY